MSQSDKMPIVAMQQLGNRGKTQMLNVEPIENGTVIDHIRAGKGKKVVEMLGIDKNSAGRVALVMNVPSKRLNKKDIVKIEGTFLNEEQTNLVALMAPQSTINIIKNGKVVEKREVEIPNLLKKVGICPNPNCICNTEHAERIFSKEEQGFRCHYCERNFKADELVR